VARGGIEPPIQGFSGRESGYADVGIYLPKVQPVLAILDSGMLAGAYPCRYGISFSLQDLVLIKAVFEPRREIFGFRHPQFMWR
jgi:hypothetical protein